MAKGFNSIEEALEDLRSLEKLGVSRVALKEFYDKLK